MIPIPLEEIKNRLEGAFPGGHIEVGDMTGTGDHIRVLVVSDQFKDMSLLEQHRLVFSPFEKDLGDAIHAFSIKTMTPDVFKSLNP